MGIILRQSVQNTIISYIGVALGFVVTIWLYPQILTAEQYGLTRVLLSLAMVSTQFANLGMKNTIIRYFPFFRDKDKNHHGFLFLSLIIPLIGLLFLSVLLVLFRSNIIRYFIERSELLVEFYWFILPLAFFILFFHVLTSFIQALYDTVMSSFLMNIAVRILVVLALITYSLGWISFEQFIFIFVLNYAIILLALIIYLFKITSVSLKPNFSFLRKPLVKSIFNYSMFAFFGGVASILVSNIDIIMLSSMAGLEETGIYAIAFYIGSAITITRTSIYKISSPVIADAFKEKDYNLIEDIYRRSSLNQIIAGGLLFCGVIANLENLINLLPPAYSGGALVIIIIGVANIFDMATGINGGIILNSKHYRFDLWSTLFLIVVTVALNYLLIPVYGIVGAAIGTASAIFLYNSLKVIFVWIHFSMQPFKWQMLLVLLIGGLTLLLSFQIPFVRNLFLDILIRSVIVTILYLVPILTLKISDDLNNLAAESLKRIGRVLKN